MTSKMAFSKVLVSDVDSGGVFSHYLKKLKLRAP